MFIVPYMIREKASNSEFKTWTAWIFMKDGLWETEEGEKADNIVREYLEPNGLKGRLVGVKGNCLLFEVDPSLTQIGDFYSWEDSVNGTLPANSHYWRPFIWCGGEFAVADDWGWAEECSQVGLGKFGSVLDLWEVLRAGSAV